MQQGRFEQLRARGKKRRVVEEEDSGSLVAVEEPQQHINFFEDIEKALNAPPSTNSDREEEKLRENKECVMI